MKKEQILELMNAVPPDLIEEADILAPAKRRRPGFVRTGLIAACLCLALIGTTFAAVYYFSVQVFSNEEHAGYSISGSVTKYSLDSFSTELQAACKSWEGPNPIQPEFDTWDEAKAFLGENIPCVWPELELNQFSARVTLTQDYDSHELIGVGVYHYGIFSDLLICRATAAIYAEGYPEDVEHIGGLWDNPERDVKSLGTYTMANGTTAEIVMNNGTMQHVVDTATGETVLLDLSFSRECTGIFIHSGILYQVTINAGIAGDIPQSEIETRLHQVLDMYP